MDGGGEADANEGEKTYKHTCTQSHTYTEVFFDKQMQHH